MGAPIRIFVVAFGIGEIQDTHCRLLCERDAETGGNKMKRVVQVWQMDARHVVYERTFGFRGAHAAV
jgi:hypothetical protein